MVSEGKTPTRSVRSLMVMRMLWGVPGFEFDLTLVEDEAEWRLAGLSDWYPKYLSDEEYHRLPHRMQVHYVPNERAQKMSHKEPQQSQSQTPLMHYDPRTGAPRPYPSEARQYRVYHAGSAWLFDPYTGRRRTAEDVGSDPQGLLICGRSNPGSTAHAGGAQ